MGCTNYFTFRGNSTVTLPAWVSLIVFDTVVFLLTLFRALYHCKFSMHICSPVEILRFTHRPRLPFTPHDRAHKRRLPVLLYPSRCVVKIFIRNSEILIRNHVLALGIANLLLNLLTISSVSDRLSFLCTPVLRASFSIIGSRIMLNLRRAASSPTQTDFTSDSLSA